MTERQADMADDAHGDKTQEEPQAQEDLGQQQATQDQPQVSGTDWEKAVAERDEKIAALEAQVAKAAKTQRRPSSCAARSRSSRPRVSPTVSTSGCSSRACAT